MVSRESVSVRAVAPSNIALIKYWGKSDASLNWPANDSLSMTLHHARSITTARAWTDAQSPGSHRISFGDAGTASRVPEKTTRFLEWLRAEVARHGSATGALDITTRNTFPSSCGIASSASGFAALTMAATGAWTGARTIADLENIGIDRAKLAAWARRGSGSACRSIHGGYVHWQRGASPAGQNVSSAFSRDDWPLADLIVLVDDKAKHVSSSEGHARAFTSLLMAPRVAALPERLRETVRAIESRDLERLGTIIEGEAMEMHSVMMTSTPRTDYFSEPTTRFLAWLRAERVAGNLNAWFTLDAGPNPHLICRPEDSAAIATRIKKEFPAFPVIEDHTGNGATLEAVDGH
ncbi:diphosphomevalonate decarboxylase [bacterium]|nr:diphosphomevalonate decarboxylase [bacterium]